MPYPSRWPQDEPELLALYQREWAKTNARPCQKYTEKMIDQLQNNKKTYSDSLNKLLNSEENKQSYKHDSYVLNETHSNQKAEFISKASLTDNI